MKVVVGLGNPGKTYENTRHNIGFEIIDLFKREYQLTFQGKFKSLCAQTTVNGEKVLFVLPQTFMNLSGEAVIEIVNFYKIDKTVNLLVIYDDMDLPTGKLRFRAKGSAGGHNGIKSITQHLGSDFYRLKVGIGKSPYAGDTVNFVLGKFTKEEESIYIERSETIRKAVETFISGESIETLMQKFN